MRQKGMENNMRKLRSAVALLLVWLLTWSCAIAEVPLLQQAADWDLSDTPVEVTLSASLQAHMPFDENRLAMLQEVLEPLSLSLYAYQDESAVSILMNGASILALSQRGNEAQISCVPGVSYTAQGQDVLSLMLASDVTTGSFEALDGTYEQWLDDGWVVLTGLLEPFAEYGNRKSVKTTVKDMGLARSCTDYSVSKGKLEQMQQTLLDLCPEGDLHDLLASLTFSGVQKLRVYRTEDDVPLRMEYNGVCGVNGKLRTVKLVWRMKRESDEMRDEITLTAPAKSGTDKNTLSFTRVVTLGKSSITVTGDYSYKVTANKQTSLTEATFEMTNIFSSEADELTGRVVIKRQPNTSEKAKTTTTISPSMHLSGTSDDPRVQGSIAYEQQNNIGVTEAGEISILLQRAEGSPWTEQMALVDLSKLDAEALRAQQSQIASALTIAIVRPLMQTLGAEKASYFFQDMSAEEVAAIMAIADSAVELE